LKKKVMIILAVCLVGIGAGMFMRTMTVKASTPEKGCPVTVEGVPTVVYDEEWLPLAALVTAEKNPAMGATPEVYEVAKYSFTTNQVTFKDGSTRRLSDVSSGVSRVGVEVLPKFKVTRWQVSGHAHFK
jgi:hypothetical protein